MGIDVGNLAPIEATALLTHHARALDSRSAHPILGDSLAAQVSDRIDYHFAGLGVGTSVVCQTALRAKMLDDRVRAFVAAHPNAVVVDLGGGLDCGAYRVDPPRSVDWYTVDLPAVVALRDDVLPPRPSTHSIGASLAERDWPDVIPPDRPTMLIADGLLAFLAEAAVIDLFRRIPEHFGNGELAFNDYGGIGWFSKMAIRLLPQKMYHDVGSQWGYAGFKDAHYPQTWTPRLTLVEESSLTKAAEVELFPPALRIATRLSGMTTTGARKARILRYRF